MSAKPLTFPFFCGKSQILLYLPVARSSSETLYGGLLSSALKTWIGFGYASQSNFVRAWPGVVQSYALASAASA